MVEYKFYHLTEVQTGLKIQAKGKNITQKRISKKVGQNTMQIEKVQEIHLTSTSTWPSSTWPSYSCEINQRSKGIEYGV